MFEVRISLFLIFLIDDAVRHYFEETGSVDGSCITQMQVHLLCEMVFEMEVRQTVPILLVTLSLSASRIFEHISLIGMFGSESSHDLHFPLLISGHAIHTSYLLRGIIVERVTHVAICSGSNQDFIKVVPVGTIYLILLSTGGTVEGVLVEEGRSHLVAVHASRLYGPVVCGMISEIQIGSLVLVGIMLPSACGRLIRLYMTSLQEYLGIVRGLVSCIGIYAFPVHLHMTGWEIMGTRERGIVDLLSVVLQPDV